MSTISVRMFLFCSLVILCAAVSPPAMASQVVHPAGVIKAADLQRAHENIQRYDWAKDYLTKLQNNTDYWLPKLTPEYLKDMIPDTTPGDALFTPCPACRDLGKPYLPHGDWSWDPKHPDILKCKICGTVFPNPKYPESVVLHTKWGKPQTLTFMGGKPFPVFAYKQDRPSMSGNIRARKVDFMSSLLENIGEAYSLTGKLEYAKAAHDILIRLATVYPYYLVHEGYGEYADMDPQVAADHINNLPQDELVYPPNKPDRKLITGYWSAGRARGVGMEGTFVRRVAGAYDVTCDAKNANGSSIYNDADRANIEKNLLVESTKLLVADKQINNKAVGNRCAAGIVGLIVGDPKLVRFGMEGFDLTVNSWFLPDGGTPESPAYAMMTLNGTAQFVQALRGYSDPPGFRDANGKRYDNFDPYHDTNYGKVWDGMFNTLQGDLLYPSFADSYQTTGLGARFAELMADNYPKRPQYMALLKEYVKGDWSKVYAPTALYYGEPGREIKAIPALDLPSNILPDLRIGYMRSGMDGRESLLLLSASHWGSHHHEDSLNLYYWKDGEELLTDLGYLWDNPNKHKTARTEAHNTVLIDEKEQVTKGRGGDVEYFLNKPHVRAMRASSKAYPNASIYERASTLIDHGSGHNYVVDVFWAQGGTTQDYVFHGPNRKYHIDAAQTPFAEKLYDFTNVQQIKEQPDAPWKVVWDMNPKMQFTAWNLPGSDETSLIGDGWGQRDKMNKDFGATLPYIVRRSTGADLHSFVSVFEGHATGNAYVQKVTRLPVQGNLKGVVALRIDTTDSHDYVIASQVPGAVFVTTPDGIIECSGKLAVLSVQNGKSTYATVDSGELRLKGQLVKMQ